jgi:fucose 4-O-acetylase-like acetyltransferase
MPFFIFISGYFFSSKGSWLAYVKKKTVRLLLPALFLNLLYGILTVAARQSGLIGYGNDITLARLFISPIVDAEPFPLAISLWFLFQLYVIEMMMATVIRIRWKHLDHALLAVSLILCTCGLFYAFRYRQAFVLPTGLKRMVFRTCFLFFFFVLGFYYRTRLEKKIKIRPFPLLACIVLVQGLYLAITNQPLTFNSRDMNMQSVPFFLSPLVTSLTATTALLCIAKLLSPLLQNNRVVLWLGSNTRYIVYHHQICFLLLNCVYVVLFARLRMPYPDQGLFNPLGIFQSRWHVFSLSSHLLGRLPYVIIPTLAPVLVASLINHIQKRPLRFLAWGALYALILVVILVMGKYASESLLYQ